MARILVIGNATVDIINHVTEYPSEDAEVRAVAQEVRRGGNAANTAVALARLGHACTWAGTLADDPEGAVIRADLTRHGVDLGAAYTVPGGKVPTSYITLSRAGGSRTIVHYRDLPEYPYSAFAALDLDRFAWVHCEGRNLDELVHMLERLRQHHPDLPCSLEVEKPRPGIERLFHLPGLLLFSRAYAAARDLASAARLFAAVRPAAARAELVCGWGADGAWGLGRDGTLVHAAAHSPQRVVDTIGAGDVLNAALIDARVRGMPLGEALAHAVVVAGRKCGRYGIDF